MSGGPPSIPSWLAKLIPATYREEWIGDLAERWSAEERSLGRRRATARLWVRLLRSAVDARIVARRLEGARDDHRGGDMGTGLGRDVRLGVRMLVREPVAAGAALCTLALGVWAFLTGFALVDAALLERFGYPEEDRLVLVGEGPGALFGITMRDHQDVVEVSDLFEEGALWQGWGVLLRPEQGAWSMVSGASVSSDYLQLLGARPALGRLFGPDDDRPGHDPVIVLSHAAWTTRFGGRADVLGLPIEHEGVTYTVVGVLAEGFRDAIPRMLGWNEPELWRASPPNFDAVGSRRDDISFWTLARLREGITAADANRGARARSAEMLGVSAEELGLQVRPFGDVARRRSRSSLLLLLGAGLAVLLVSGANLVNLLLARGTGRAPEMAVRAALGARRGRLVRQLLVEGAILGVCAAAVGALLTRLTLEPIVRLSTALLPPRTEVALDGGVVLVAVAVALTASVLAALPPALVATRRSHLSGLREGRRAGVRRSPLQTGLVVTQTALAVALVAASGLLLRTLWALGAQDIGFDADSVTASYLALHREMFAGDDDQSGTLDALEARWSTIPRVGAAAAITDLPMSGRVNSTNLRRVDQPEGSELERLQTLVRAITPGYFEVLGIDLVAGRLLDARDRADATHVAVVNRTYAARHFPGEDPLGRVLDVRGVERTIVGIVDDVTEFSVGAARDPVLYLPYHQEVLPWMRAGVYVVLRTEGDTPSLDVLRAAAAEVDPRLAVGSPFRLSNYVERDSAGHRFRAVLATGFGVLALILASVGLAGVTAYVVGKRTRELGVRVALGASPKRLAAMVLRGSGVLTAIGIALGVLLALPMGRALSGFLFEVQPVDPLTLGVAGGTLATASVLASLAPVRRALRVDPVDALRQE